MTPEEIEKTPNPIRKKYEDKIRRDYEGILGDAQIEATIQWWAETLEPLYRKIEELKEEIKVIEEKNRELEKANKAIKLIVSPAEERLQEIITGLESKLAKAIKTLRPFANARRR